MNNVNLETVKKNISLLRGILLSGREEWRTYLLKLAREYYTYTGEKGALSIIIDNETFDELIKKIDMCDFLLENKKLEEKKMYNLLKHALPDIIYYSINDTHLNSGSQRDTYLTYDPNNTCIVIIRMKSEYADQYYHCTEIISMQIQ